MQSSSPPVTRYTWRAIAKCLRGCAWGSHILDRISARSREMNTEIEKVEKIQLQELERKLSLSSVSPSHLQPQAIQLSLISPHPGKTKPRWVQVSLAWIFHKESTKSIDASRVHLDRGPLQEINSPRGVVRPRQNARSRQRIRRVLEPQQRGIHSGFRSEEGFMARFFIAWCPLCQWHAAWRGASVGGRVWRQRAEIQG